MTQEFSREFLLELENIVKLFIYTVTVIIEDPFGKVL